MLYQRIKSVHFLVLTAAIALGSCNQQPSSTRDIPIYLDTNYSFRERAADLVSKMTLHEEVQQLRTNHAPAIPRLGVQEYYYWSECQHGVNALHGNIVCGDKANAGSGHIHSTSFPVNFASAMSWDPELIYKETTAISDEARGFLDKSLWGKAKNNLGDSAGNYGSLTYWAPTINMDRDPRWGRTDEGFGEDPFLASKMAGAFVNGLQGQTMDGHAITGYLKVAATAKHYALNNAEDVRHNSSSDAGDGLIRDYYTQTFRNLIEKAHVAGLMTAYNAINGTPSAANTYTVNELARRTYGFNGYITSDCSAIGDIYENFPQGHAWAPPGWTISYRGEKAVWINKQTGDSVSAAAGAQAFAIRAGTELNCRGDEYTFNNIKEAIKAGILSKGVIDRALTNVFTIRMKTGEFDPRSKVPYTRITKSVIEDPAHRELAEKVAENTIVLLKDSLLTASKERLLPVNIAKVNKIVIIGNLAEKVTLGGYSSDPTLQVSAVQGVKTAVKKMNPNASVTFYGAKTSTKAKSPAVLSDRARSDIRSADLVVVFMGTNEAVAREGHDRKTLAIPGNYGSMIKQVTAMGNPRMVLVIQSNGPVDISKVRNKFPAILFSGYNGESQGTALANVLSGRKNPSGHLNFTWYKNDTQLPGILNYHLAPGKTKGLGRTYMYFTGEPAYPFGYGLSYTRFRYSGVKISTQQASPDDKVKISFNVTNTGKIPGAAVAQLYVGYPKIRGKELPERKLEGFQKTKELDPGETRQISFTVDLSDLALWNEKDLKEMVYNGTYQFQVGYNSDDIVATKEVVIRGSLTPEILRVTIEPPRLIYYIGDTLNLNGKNKWIKSDVNQKTAQYHAPADHIIEAVRNDGSFVNLRNMKVTYNSDNNSVASVSKEGVVRAKSTGVATITATVNNVSGSAVIVIKQRPSGRSAGS